MSLAYDFSGRRVLVTGAARGIGECITRKLHAAGAHVVAADRDADGLAALSGALGERVTAITSDIGTVEGVLSLAAAAQELGPLHGLVNVAGIAIFEPFAETSAAAWDLQFNVNVRALAFLTKEVSKGMVASSVKGSVVNISSQSSKLAIKDHLAYSSSKAAVDHVTRISALELGASGIRVNAVNPTVVMTELAKKAWSADGLKTMVQSIPLKRFAEPGDVADAVLFLLSDSSSMVSGVTLPVDGGWTAAKVA